MVAQQKVHSDQDHPHRGPGRHGPPECGQKTRNQEQEQAEREQYSHQLFQAPVQVEHVYPDQAHAYAHAHHQHCDPARSALVEQAHHNRHIGRHHYQPADQDHDLEHSHVLDRGVERGDQDHDQADEQGAEPSDYHLGPGAGVALEHPLVDIPAQDRRQVIVAGIDRGDRGGEDRGDQDTHQASGQHGHGDGDIARLLGAREIERPGGGLHIQPGRPGDHRWQAPEDRPGDEQYTRQQGHFAGRTLIPYREIALGVAAGVVAENRVQEIGHQVEPGIVTLPAVDLEIVQLICPGHESVKIAHVEQAEHEHHADCPQKKQGLDSVVYAHGPEPADHRVDQHRHSGDNDHHLEVGFHGIGQDHADRVEEDAAVDERDGDSGPAQELVGGQSVAGLQELHGAGDPGAPPDPGQPGSADKERQSAQSVHQHPGEPVIVGEPGPAGESPGAETGHETACPRYPPGHPVPALEIFLLILVHLVEQETHADHQHQIPDNHRDIEIGDGFHLRACLLGKGMVGADRLDQRRGCSGRWQRK